MDMKPWGASFLNTIAILSAVVKNSGSELVQLTIVEDIVEVSLEKGGSTFIMPLHIDKLTEENTLEVLTNIAQLAQMEHAGSLLSNKTVH